MPEILFHPADVGINQTGISHCIYHAIESCPEEVRPHLYENILCAGGNACFEGFKERIYKDVRSLADCLFDVEVNIPPNPVIEAWNGGKLLVSESRDTFDALCITKKDYEEHGLQFCIDKFDV